MKDFNEYFNINKASALSVVLAKRVWASRGRWAMEPLEQHRESVMELAAGVGKAAPVAEAARAVRAARAALVAAVIAA